MKKMALKSTFGFTTVNHYYTEEERQVITRQSKQVSAIKKNMFFKTNQIPFIRLLLELDVFRFFLKNTLLSSYLRLTSEMTEDFLSCQRFLYFPTTEREQTLSAGHLVENTEQNTEEGDRY